MENTSLKTKVSGGMKSCLCFIFAVIMLCAVCAVTFTVGRFMSGKSIPVSGSARISAKLPIIVIDAGHGGRDGGAVGRDGTVEKDLNLSVAKRLEALLKLSGIPSVMTRTEDIMLTPEDVTSHRKMHDLKNRLAVVNELSASGQDVILVSIHMNNFSSPKYSGLQVWYSKNHDGSRSLASFVQSYAKTFLDTDNNREIKAAGSSIYLLERATVPAVLIECGFLSNPEECEKLASDEYQTELAVTMYAALCRWLANA